jgi:probable F420-dependent oxidoreductase
VRFWINAGFLEIDQLAELALRAEELGFEGLSMPEHVFLPEHIDSAYPYSADGSVTWDEEEPWPEPLTAIAALGAASRSLRFTTSILIAPLRDVFSLAKAAATAAGFAPGRVSLGLGAGWLREEFEIVGQSFEDRGSILDEMIDVLPKLWSGELVEHEGPLLPFPSLRMRPGASLPILTGGHAPAALRRAARADGWIGAHASLESTADDLRKLAVARGAAGRSEAPFEVLLAAMPRHATDAPALEELGVDGLIIPALALAGGDPTATIAGMESFATRWLP